MNFLDEDRRSRSFFSPTVENNLAEISEILKQPPRTKPQELLVKI